MNPCSGQIGGGQRCNEVLAEDHPDRLASQRALTWAYEEDSQVDRLESKVLSQVGKTAESAQAVPPRSIQAGAASHSGSSQVKGEEADRSSKSRKWWHKLRGRK